MRDHASTTGSDLYSSPATATAIQRVTLLGLLANTALVAIKFAAGWLGNSQALIADAVHSLSDSVTDVALLIGLRFWTQPPDEQHPHGHRRIETLITIFIAMCLAAVGVGLCWRAVATLCAGDRHVPTTAAFFAALLSITVKEWLYRWTRAVGERVKSTAVIANAWHHRSDAFSSIPVAIAVGATMINPAWAALDQIGAILVSFFILYAAWGILHPALAELIDAGAPPAVCTQLTALAQDVEGVRDLRNLRTRFQGGKLQVDLNVLVDKCLTVDEGHTIAHCVREALLASACDVIDVLVHIEPYEPLEPGSP
jgi:cation diffusion facilitator family transporter